jgi:hypothetical protein
MAGRSSPVFVGRIVRGDINHKKTMSMCSLQKSFLYYSLMHDFICNGLKKSVCWWDSAWRYNPQKTMSICSLQKSFFILFAYDFISNGRKKSASCLLPMFVGWNPLKYYVGKALLFMGMGLLKLYFNEIFELSAFFPLFKQRV